MMQPIEVQEFRSLPVLVTWRNYSAKVTAIIDSWSEMGRWWEGEPTFHYYFVKTERRELLLALDTVDGLWYAKPL